MSESEPAPAAEGSPGTEGDPSGQPAGSPQRGENPGGDQGPEASKGSDSTSEEAASPDEAGGVAGAVEADQPGAASDWYAHLQAARHLYGGDRVGGDKFVYYLSGGEQSAPLRRLSPTLAELARHAFVTPDGWDDRRIEFRDRRTVLLRGMPGHGRVTMAIRLLQTVGTQAIYQLDPRTDLTRLGERLAAQRLDHGSALLLCQPDDVARLDAYTFESLEAPLAEVDARLVVTVGTDVSFLDNGLLRYQMELPLPPSLREILHRHLCHLLEDESRAEQILAQPDVEALVAEKLDGPETACELAAFLALLLSRAAEPIDAAVLRTSLGRHASDEFDIWFESLDDLRLRCFAVALAVLDGLPYEDVADAARRLHDAFSTGDPLVLGEDSTLRTAGSDPFRINRVRLLRLLQARTERTVARTPYGSVPVTAVAYRNAEYPRLVFERAWREYQIQDELLDWLGQLAVVNSDQVRAFASTALGMLATSAFEFVRERAISPWAGSPETRRREAAAEALGVAAREPALQPSVTRLVDLWYRSLNPRLKATAALAHGTRLGRPDADRSIQALERLARVDNFDVRMAIARGFTWLLVQDAESLAPELFAAVTRCMSDSKRTVPGQFTFLAVAIALLTEITEPDGTVGRWPTLLYLVREQRHLQQALSELWARVLTEGQQVGAATTVLRTWAAYAEANTGVWDTFVRLARAIGRTDARAGAVLVRLAKQWNSDDELLPMPSVAHAVENVIPR